MFRFLTGFFLFLSFFFSSPLWALSEINYFKKIKQDSITHKYKQLQEKANLFFKKFPKSKHLPEIRLFLAEAESNPKKAIKKYKVLVNKYRYYSKRDQAQYRVCQIYYLLSDWETLELETKLALKKFPQSSYRYDFQLLLIKAYTNLGEYDLALKKGFSFLKDTHDYEKLSKLLILMADLKKKTSGFSKKYLSALKDLAEGFKKSSNHPSVLYLLGEYYQKKKDYNRSYSAYHDLKQKYPNSPEANLALGNIKKLKKKKPLLVDYFPSKKIISEAEDLDISPERKIFKKKVHDNYYAISIGPFPSSQAALQIKRMIKNLGRVRMVQLKRGYLLYVGQLNLLENALQLKIRIGEEYGVNGRIVKIIDDQLKEYVYGE